MTSLERFEKNLPYYVICSDSKRFPPKNERYLPKQYALSKPYIVANYPKYNHYLVFDVDHKDSWTLWDTAGLPIPTIIVENNLNGHSHYFYELFNPLPSKNRRSEATKRLLDSIIQYYKFALGSHKAIVDQCQLTKNALSDEWKRWGASDNCGLYGLNGLADYIKAIQARKLPKNTNNQDSRNCYLFDCGRSYAYEIVKNCSSESELSNSIWNYLNELYNNEIKNQFSNKGIFTISEVRSITKSISGWVWERKQDFQLLKPSNRNIGALGLTPMGSGWNYQDSKEEVKKRQKMGAEYSNRVRKEKAEKAIREGVQQCKEKELEITTKNVSELSKVNIRTVQRYSGLLE